MPSRRGFNSLNSHKLQYHAQSDSDSPDNSFTSALDLCTPRPTALRRRGSDDGTCGSLDRSISPHASDSDLHPLRRSSTTIGTARYDTGSTRPRLSRVLSSSSPVLARPDPPPPGKVESSRRAVFVHKVWQPLHFFSYFLLFSFLLLIIHTQILFFLHLRLHLQVLLNDTLAGVALKYGISVTELRRANQLWASDSIHLRQVLYVPLDKARHANLETVASLLARETDNEEDTVSAPASGPDTASSLDPSPVIRRVPSTSLSFFPPPSSGARSDTILSPSESRSHSPSPASTTSTPSRVPTATRTNALSSLFSVLPINASTRDEIISRLSIDSVSNSTAGTASDDEHELTAVPAIPKPRPDLFASITAKPERNRPPRGWLADSREADGRQGPYERNVAVEQIALSSSSIHTTQMQPAVAMQLPEYMTRSPFNKGATRNDSHNGTRRSPSDHPRTR
jgi:LysM repeat protein